MILYHFDKLYFLRNLPFYPNIYCHNIPLNLFYIYSSVVMAPLVLLILFICASSFFVLSHFLKRLINLLFLKTKIGFINFILLFYFIDSFFLLPLTLDFLHLFTSFLKRKVIFNLLSSQKQAIKAINFPLSTALGADYRFWFVIIQLSLIYSLIWFIFKSLLTFKYLRFFFFFF